MYLKNWSPNTNEETLVKETLVGKIFGTSTQLDSISNFWKLPWSYTYAEYKYCSNGLNLKYSLLGYTN